jgi:hypothetical protein
MVDGATDPEIVASLEAGVIGRIEDDVDAAVEGQD